MFDKELEHLQDIEEEGVSDCCGAVVYLDICSECGEHCGIEEDEEWNI